MNDREYKWLALLRLLIQWSRTSDPQKKFPLEIQLMAWGQAHSRWLRKKFQRRIFYCYSCDISPSAKINPSVKFPHPTGVVIGSNAIIDKECIIYQQVTIGSDFGEDNSMAHLQSGTKVGAGAKVIGGIIIGEQCVIGTGAVVTKDIPSYSMVVGANKVIHK